MIKKIVVLVVSVLFFLLTVQVFGAAKTVRQILNEHVKAQNETERRQLQEDLSKTEPQTREDADDLKVVMTQKEWNEGLYRAAMKSLSKVKNPTHDVVLIEILKTDREFLGKAASGNFQGRSEQETKLRGLNAERTIRKLSDLQSVAAVPILREYLDIKGLRYAASEALAKIGDKTTREEIKERAYKGEDINYGGAGIDAALNVVKDLKDRTKSDKWPKIAKQLILIKDPSAKPNLRELFTHEKKYVRAESATAFQNMADSQDIPALLEMTKNKDWFVRSAAIHAIKRINDPSLDDVLISLMVNDPHRSPRANAAKALGYKKIARAVPFLEKAINDKEIRVRQEAFVALYILTGNKSDFAGRDATIDNVAEQQRKNPTFY